MIECIITGCTLQQGFEGATVHGDLHKIGDSIVFNACLTDKGEAAWSYTKAPWQSDKVCHLIGGYFERRGVIVAESYALNATADAYVNKDLYANT